MCQRIRFEMFKLGVCYWTLSNLIFIFKQLFRKDDSRILSVYPMEGHRFFRGGIYTDSFCIKLQDDQTEIFKNYLKKYPITKFDVDKHYESPSSAGKC